MSAKTVRYIKPVMPTPEEWLPHLRESYSSGYYSNFGPAVRAFEHHPDEELENVNMARSACAAAGPG